MTFPLEPGDPGTALHSDPGVTAEEFDTDVMVLIDTGHALGPQWLDLGPTDAVVASDVRPPRAESEGHAELRAARHWRLYREAKVALDAAEVECEGLIGRAVAAESRADGWRSQASRMRVRAEAAESALAESRAKVARVEALADEWATTPGTYVQHGSVLAGAWVSAVRQIRAALSGGSDQPGEETEPHDLARTDWPEEAKSDG